MTVNLAVGISCERNSGYRPSRVNIMAQGLPIPPLALHTYLHTSLRHHWLMPISCHFWDCKALLVTILTHVSGAIASVQTFTFTFIRRGPATTTHYTINLAWWCRATLSGLRTGPACKACLSVGMRRERVPHQRIKIKIKPYHRFWHTSACIQKLCIYNGPFYFFRLVFRWDQRLRPNGSTLVSDWSWD